jgi:hypothetical protein
MFKEVLWSNILQLNNEQSKLFHEYCELISDHSIDPEKRTELMSCIWSKAIDDLHLADCLELVDYFMDLEPLDSNIDKRAYISEYLLEEVESLIMKSGKGKILEEQQKLALNDKYSFFQPHAEDSQKSPMKATISLVKETTSEFVTEVVNRFF